MKWLSGEWKLPGLRQALLIMLIISFLVFGCTKEEPIKIGFLGILSGKLSSMGVSARNSVELAIEAVNQNGGIAGRRLELIVENTANDPQKVQKRIGNFLDEHVKFVICIVTSNMAIPLIESTDGKDILAFTPTISADSIENRDDNLFRFALLASDQAKVLANIAIRKKYSKVGIVYDSSNKDYADVIYRLFVAEFQGSGRQIVYWNNLAVKSSAAYQKLAQELAKTNAEALVLVCSGIDGAQIVQQVKKIGLDLQVFGSSWLITNDYIKHGGKAVEGTILVSNYEKVEKSQLFRQFDNQYFARFQKKSEFVAVESYDTIQVLISALKATRSDQPAVIKDWIIKHPRFEGLESDFMVNKYGDAHKPYSFFEVINGSFVNIGQ